MNFQEQTIMITGACGNLGAAVSAAFDRAGAQLVLVDRAEDRLLATFGERTQRRLPCAADLRDSAAVGRTVEQALSRFGSIDVLCNLAGTFRMGPSVHETTDEDWDLLFDANLRSTLNAVRGVVPAMIEAGRGRIVNVAANAALRGAAGMGPYCAAKDAVIRLTESMSAELRDRHINVNCVLPTILDTPENRAAMPDQDFARWVAPDALADVIVFLASDAARAIHGAAIPVTGRL